MPSAHRQSPSFDIRNYSEMRCPMHGLLSLLSGPWTTLILWFVYANGAMRFGELKKQMPTISAKVLTQRLRKLEEAGILLRAQEATIPPKVIYSLTERGRQLNALLDEVNTLAQSWGGAPAAGKCNKLT